MIDLYGEGLERIFAALAEDRARRRPLRERLADDGVVASLMLIHDLYPVAARRAGGRGARQRAPVHGVARRQRRAARDRATGVARIRLEGSCDGCPASSVDARAGDQAGARRGGARPRGPRGRGRGRRRRRPPRPSAGGMELPVIQVRRRGRGAAAPAVVVRARRRSRELGGGRADPAPRSRVTTLVVASVDGSLLAFRDPAPPAAPPLAGGELDRGDARLPGLRAPLLPAPRRPLARRRPAAARAGAAARGRGRRPGGAAASSRR